MAEQHARVGAEAPAATGTALSLNSLPLAAYKPAPGGRAPHAAYEHGGQPSRDRDDLPTLSLPRDTAQAMSQENVEIVRAIFVAWEKGDFSSGEWADPEIEFRSVAEGGPTYGIAAMGRRCEWLKAFEHFSTHPEEYLDTGNVVLVMNRFLGTGKGSDAPISDFQGACLFALRDGRVVRLVLFTDRRKALEAAGLSE